MKIEIENLKKQLTLSCFLTSSVKILFIYLFVHRVTSPWKLSVWFLININKICLNYCKSGKYLIIYKRTLFSDSAYIEAPICKSLCFYPEVYIELETNKKSKLSQLEGSCWHLTLKLTLKKIIKMKFVGYLVLACPSIWRIDR